jgi:hypothetical protein
VFSPTMRGGRLVIFPVTVVRSCRKACPGKGSGFGVGIRGRLVWLSVGVAVPLALVGLAALWGLWRESREQVNLSVEGQAQLAAVAFERWIEGQRHPLQTIAAQLGAPRAASGGAGATAQQPEALAPLLRAVVSNRPYWLDLHALDARGATLLAQPPQTGPLPPGVVTDVLEELRRSSQTGRGAGSGPSLSSPRRSRAAGPSSRGRTGPRSASCSATSGSRRAASSSSSTRADASSTEARRCRPRTSRM